MCPSLRVVVNEAGAARRPAHRGRMVLIVLGCALTYVIGYIVVARLLGTR